MNISNRASVVALRISLSRSDRIRLEIREGLFAAKGFEHPNALNRLFYRRRNFPLVLERRVRIE